MRDFGTAPLAMDAMAVEKKVMAQVGNKGEEVVNPNKRSSTKFCKSNIYDKNKRVTKVRTRPEGRGGGTLGTGCKGNPLLGGSQSASHG